MNHTQTTSRNGMSAYIQRNCSAVKIPYIKTQSSLHASNVNPFTACLLYIQLSRLLINNLNAINCASLEGGTSEEFLKRE